MSGVFDESTFTREERFRCTTCGSTSSGDRPLYQHTFAAGDGRHVVVHEARLTGPWRRT